MTDRTLITPESGAIVIEGCSIFNHPRIRGRYRSSHLCRLSPALYPLPRRLMPADPRALRRGSATVERHETPRTETAGSNAISGVSSAWSRKPDFRLSHHHSAQAALPEVRSRKTGIRITRNAPATSHIRDVTVTSRGVTQSPSVRILMIHWARPAPSSGTPTDGSMRAQGTPLTGGASAQKMTIPTTAGRSPNFAHPQLAGRPCRKTSGGILNAGRGPFFLGRPLNSFFINVQKKGDSGAPETQQKPTGFLGGSTC